MIFVTVTKYLARINVEREGSGNNLSWEGCSRGLCSQVACAVRAERNERWDPQLCPCPFPVRAPDPWELPSVFTWVFPRQLDTPGINTSRSVPPRRFQVQRSGSEHEHHHGKTFHPSVPSSLLLSPPSPHISTLILWYFYLKNERENWQYSFRNCKEMSGWKRFDQPKQLPGGKHRTNPT